MGLVDSDRLLVFQLLQELDAIPRTEFREAVVALQRGVQELLGADEVRIVLALRDETLPADDPFYGWRVRRILQTYEGSALSRHLDRMLRGEEYVIDPGAQALAAGHGTTRVLRRGEGLDATYSDSPLSAALLAAGIHDMLQGSLPLDDARELAISASRVENLAPYGTRERELLLLLLEGLRRHAWRIAAAHGLLAEAMLTGRERETLAWLLRGLSETEIADEMGLALRTVHGHVLSLYRKFGVHSRPELTALWLQ